MMEFSYKFKVDNLYPIIEIILEKDKTKIRLSKQANQKQ